MKQKNALAKSSRRLSNFKKTVEFGAFVFPAVIMVILVFVIPFIMDIFYSMTEWNGISKEPIFVGLMNFKEILSNDRAFKNSMNFTMVYTCFYVIIVNVLALMLAVVLDKKIRGAKTLRAAFFTPFILSLIIVGFVWKFILSRGFANIYEITGWEFFSWSWLGDAFLAKISVLFVSIWQSIGFYMVIYIAGMQAIPFDVLEAASIDGASNSKTFFRVVLPLLGPSVTSCVFMSTTNGIKVYDIIISLTNGGPGTATNSITMDIYRNAFSDGLYGYSTAKSLILFVIVLVITVAELSVFKRREVEA